MKIWRWRIGKPELAATAGLIVYTFGRFLAAGGTMTKYGVDARWFLFWDAAPIPVYVWAIGKLVRGLSDDGTHFSQLVVAALAAMAAFMCPYFYLFYAGATEFPGTAWAILIVVIGLLAANAVRDVRRKVRVARDENQGGQSSVASVPASSQAR